MLGEAVVAGVVVGVNVEEAGVVVGADVVVGVDVVGSDVVSVLDMQAEHRIHSTKRIYAGVRFILCPRIIVRRTQSFATVTRLRQHSPHNEDFPK